MLIRHPVYRCSLAAWAVATACQPAEEQQHSLREFVEVQAISSVEAHNYSGHHWLTAKELQDFKDRFGAMRYEPGGSGQVKSVDMGSTVFVLHSRGRTYHLIGSPTSQYLGVPNSLATRNRPALSAEDQNGKDLLLFEFNRPTNVNNYRKGPKLTEPH